MSIIYNLPGLNFVEYVAHPNINHGQPLPLFEPVSSTDKPNINTIDGWNAVADRGNQKAFFSNFGREPRDRTELYEWVYSLLGRRPPHNPILSE